MPINSAFFLFQSILKDFVVYNVFYRRIGVGYGKRLSYASYELIKREMGTYRHAATRRGKGL